jgi:hypothetical protein
MHLIFPSWFFHRSGRPIPVVLCPSPVPRHALGCGSGAVVEANATTERGVEFFPWMVEETRIPKCEQNRMVEPRGFEPLTS